jgi:hypothetical protein
MEEETKTRVTLKNSHKKALKNRSKSFLTNYPRFLSFNVSANHFLELRVRRTLANNSR